MAGFPLRRGHKDPPSIVPELSVGSFHLGKFASAFEMTILQVSPAISVLSDAGPRRTVAPGPVRALALVAVQS